MRLATTLTLLTIATGTAWGGVAVTAADPATPAPASAAAPDNSVVPDPPPPPGDKVDYGIDLRIRQVFVPSALLGLFVDRTPGGASNTGIGVDLIRRRGDLELQLGFEYEHINIAEGVFIEKDKTVPGDAADYVLSPDHAPENFGWFTIEFTFMNHARINKYLSFRYGGGAGLGIMTGGVYRWDVQCSGGATNANPVPGCVPGDHVTGGTGHTSDDSTGAPESTPVKYDIPAVFPVINAIIGLQIKPTDKMVINLETGIRTLPFLGFSVGYFFP